MIQRGMRRPRKKFYISKRALRPGNVIFTIVNTLIMLCVIVVMLYPFCNTIAVSFNDAQDTLRGGIKLFPRVFSLYSYQSVFKNKLMVIAAINSVLRTLISTVLGVLFGSMIAYVLSRKELVAKKFITSYFLVTMYISAGLIPNYFLMKDLKMIKNNHDIESLQVMLIKMIEDRMLSEDDYNLITKYLDKLKNDLNKK